ncbi:chemotaxis response regulator protein-glutamate methylesterase [Sphingomonas sp. KRR8]|uniref:protein-glutamate methylesterase/protein-glutamine glutaminase n=1 Tax=Sphingomonas sp. KRR8 TaxID=2942996 RepID=UPI002021DC06|nr:chemotaxis response regulator protein-glutamate methylesterase [Sphingomonas sp. KRR8]URD61921.1 chemotaxis response regulator protein-glutamate methylesterase [Sphingomonas sp. KRR8]
MSAAIRTLVVDDSAAMRAVLTRILQADGDITVVGSAPEPLVARELIKTLDPDVVTLDVEMPGMDGLSFLERIMRLRPMPVIMCSTLTARGAEVTIEALRLGAVDCVCKPSGTAAEMEREGDRLRACVRTAAGSRVRPGPLPRTPAAARGGACADRLIAVGASTGGVEALFAFLGSLPADSPPVLVVQHMPAGFTANFAARLDAEAAVKVVEARDGDAVLPGRVYVAPGGECHMRLNTGAAPSIRIAPGELVGGHRPAVDELFCSFLPVANRTTGVLLTGMGQDGAAGLLALRQAGARTLAQSAESCVVYGMPRAAVELGAVEQSIPIERMADAVMRTCAPRKDA